MVPHGGHIYDKASDVTKATMCEYPQTDHEFPSCKCVLLCCAKCLCVNITDQETDNQNSNTNPSIRFHIYHLILRCTAHVRLLLNEKKNFACVSRILPQKTNKKKH